MEQYLSQVSITVEQVVYVCEVLWVHESSEEGKRVALRHRRVQFRRELLSREPCASSQSRFLSVFVLSAIIHPHTLGPSGYSIPRCILFSVLPLHRLVSVALLSWPLVAQQTPKTSTNY